MTPDFHTSSEFIKLEILRISVQCLFSKMEIFILRQHLIAVVLFLLELMVNGGAIILSA